jgi:hypothetical protein
VLGHGWDLAVAIGQPANVGKALADAGLQAVSAIGKTLCAPPGLMASAISIGPDSSPMHRFVAAIGRNPDDW